MLASVRDKKARKCAHCSAEFRPTFNTTQKVCSPACALAMAPVHQVKARKALADIERREIKVRKEKLKSRAEYAKEAQVALNAYVRERDRDLPCISCGITYPEGRNDVWDAGHLRSVGASPATRFNLFNVNKQCVRCN